VQQFLIEPQPLPPFTQPAGGIDVTERAGLDEAAAPGAAAHCVENCGVA